MAAPLSRRSFVQYGGGGALGAALLAACGKGGSSSGGGGSNASIEYWGAFASAEDQKYFAEHFIDAFNQQSKNGTVKMSVKQIATIDRLLQTAVASGRGPDIVGTDGPAQLVAFVNNDNLRPLDEYASTYKWSNKLLTWALETGKIGGKLYALPLAYETLSMYYNPATFSQHGWKPPTTRQEFEAIAADAQSKGMMPVAAGSAEWKPASEWHVSWVLNAYAGPTALYEALDGKRPWTDPVFVDAIATMKSWWDKGWFGGSTDKYFTNKFGDLYSRLAGGKAAMMFTGSWALAEIKPYFGKTTTSGAQWDWAPLPALTSDVQPGVYPLAIGGSVSVNKTSKNPQLAAQFLDFVISDPKRQTDALAAVGFEIPPLKLTESDFPATVDARAKRQYVSLSSSKNVGYTTWTFWPPKSDTYIYEQVDKVLTGQVTPKDYCAGLDKLFQEELKAGKRPPLVAPET